ncbi:MAG: hypothetical protein AAGC55_21235, partial [Myxococcota bacterium]
MSHRYSRCTANSPTRRWTALAVLPLLALSAACLDTMDRTDVEQRPVVYGNDDRTDVGAHSDMGLRELADSVALLADRSAVTIDRNTGLTTLNAVTLSDRIDSLYGAPLCAGEAFADDSSAGWCTAFLLSPTRMATAGHCFKPWTASDTMLEQACRDMAIIFD